ncbi:MAG: hypothetical protein ACLTKT_02885 [Clostridia bacterium]|nr:hypothetical protein [Clostridium sp.]
MGTQAERQKFLDDMSNNGELKQIQQISLKKLEPIDISKKSNNRNQKNNINQKNVSKQERYTCKTRKLSKRQKQAKRMRKKISAFLTIGLLAFGSYGAKQYYDDNFKSVHLNEALRSGETLEGLGLTDEIVEDLERIKQTLKVKENLSKDQILKLGEDIEDCELSIIHEKVNNAVDKKGKVTVVPRNGNGNSSITVERENDKDVYNEQDMFKGYGVEIGNYIEGIASIQNTTENYKNDQIDRNEILEVYEGSLEKAERFASSKITVNEKGKMDFYKTTKATLENEKVASIEDEGR